MRRRRGRISTGWRRESRLPSSATRSSPRRCAGSGRRGPPASCRSARSTARPRSATRLIAARLHQSQGRPRGVAVITTPPGERHALPSLMAAACLREDHWQVQHLAADLPTEEVIGLAADTGATLIVLSSATADAVRTAARRRARSASAAAGARPDRPPRRHPQPPARPGQNPRRPAANQVELVVTGSPAFELEPAVRVSGGSPELGTRARPGENAGMAGDDRGTGCCSGWP